jgi:hypothetical protein
MGIIRKFRHVETYLKYDVLCSNYVTLSHMAYSLWSSDLDHLECRTNLEKDIKRLKKYFPHQI